MTKLIYSDTVHMGHHEVYIMVQTEEPFCKATFHILFLVVVEASNRFFFDLDNEEE